MDIVQLEETGFQESMLNPHRKGQIGMDQQLAMIFAFGWILPMLNKGTTSFYISRDSVAAYFKKEEGIVLSRSLVDKTMRRLRKDFLIRTLPQHYDPIAGKGSAACYQVNPKYLDMRPAKASDLMNLWKAQDGHHTRYFSCVSWCHKVGKRATAANLLQANELFTAGKIVKLKAVA